MPLWIIRNDITKMKVDAIVNAANPSLAGGGGVDGSIHSAAGPKLLAACRKLGGCEVGSAKLTKGYDLPAKYVIHAVGPIYQDGDHGEAALLTSCYEASLKLAVKAKCKTLAFPLISSGIYGYPKREALQIAVDTIGKFLKQQEMTVYLVIFDKAAYQISERLFSDIQSFIDDHYAEIHAESRESRIRRQNALWENFDRESAPLPQACAKQPETFREAPHPKLFQSAPSSAFPTLDALLRQVDESFSQMLLRKIDASGMSDAQVYKKANIDRKLFSKIRSDKHYKPSKPTVIAFAIALELPLPEVNEMLQKAGFALSHSNKFDLIIEFFIQNGNYNIHEINEALFAFDQSLLGA